VILKFLPQYSWCLAVSCIVISFLLKNKLPTVTFEILESNPEVEIT
jgi:hypothetical protein